MLWALEHQKHILTDGYEIIFILKICRTGPMQPPDERAAVHSCSYILHISPGIQKDNLSYMSAHGLMKLLNKLRESNKI